MATKIASVNPTCPVCFESFPVVKMLSTCKHVFCRRCLSIHLAKSSPDSMVIPCPTCRVESPLPENGVDGLVDFTRDGADEEGRELLGAVGGGDSFDEKPAESEETEGNEHCLVCRFKSNSPTVKAEYRCEDCGQFPLCRDCTMVHSQNKATQDHVVTPLKHKKSKMEVTCKPHDQMMTSYCSTCAKLVCCVCVMLDHGDHVIKKIGEIIRELLTDLLAISKEKEKQLKDLGQTETDLQEMKSMALGERDALVKAIEDHAEKCIEEILDQKKVLKAKVNADYKAIEDVSSYLEKIPYIRKKLEDSVRQAKRMVSERDIHQRDLEKIANTKESLVVSGKMADKIDGHAYLKDYQQVKRERPLFKPNMIEFSIGNLTGGANDVADDDTDPTGMTRGAQAIANVTPRLRDIRQCKLVSEIRYRNDILEVANLGNKFAVSYYYKEPSRNFQKRIDIYEFPGTLKHTVTKSGRDLRHIASTPDGNLAVLWEQFRNKYYVNILDPETSNVKSSTYLDNGNAIHGVSSFNVTRVNEYVIRQVRQPVREHQLMVYGQDGSVHHRLHMSELVRWQWSAQIACHGPFVFVCNFEDGIDACELEAWGEDHDLVHITSCKPFELIWGVSASPDGGVTVLGKRKDSVCIARSLFKTNEFTEWVYKEIKEQCPKRGNISVLGHHIVASLDNEIRVFAE